MTEQENQLVESLGNCWNQFLQLPELHPCDNQEFMVHIHALQNMVFARDGFRQYCSKQPSKQPPPMPIDEPTKKYI